MFGADVQYVATSGWGVLYPRSISAVMDYTGITVSNSVEGAKQTALWDYDSWVPDVILFNIGGNDTVSSGFEQEPYQQETVKMVENLHAHYPDAKMIWTHTGSNAGKLALAAMTDAGGGGRNGRRHLRREQSQQLNDAYRRGGYHRRQTERVLGIPGGALQHRV